MQEKVTPALLLPEPDGLERYAPHSPRQSTNGSSEYVVVEEPGENHVREYLRAVRKHWKMVVGVTLLAASLAVVYVARKPDIYAAKARVQVDLENNPGTGQAKSGTVILSNPTSDPAYFNTQIQNLTSQGLLRRVVKTLDLEHNEGYLRPNREQSVSTWQSIRRMFGLGKGAADDGPKSDGQLLLTGEVAPATAREDLAEAARLEPFVSGVEGGLKVTPVKETRTSSPTRDTRLIDINFTHQDPQVSAKVVNAIADTFVLANLERKTENTANTGDFLQKRVAELQAMIRSGEERLMNYAKSHQILSLDGSQNTVVERLVGLNKQLLEAENDRKSAEAAYRAGLAPGAASALAEGDAKQQSDIETKLTALRERRQQLLVENTEEWPEVKEINQQIAVLEKQVNEVRTRSTDVVTRNLETRYRQAAERENGIRASFNRQRAETVTQNESGINYRILQQEVETNKQLLNGLLQRSKENDVVMAGTPNNIHVVDYALTPKRPVGPQRLRLVLIATILGLGGGLGLAVMIEYLNDSIRSVDDVERWLGLPSLGVIPVVGSGKSRRSLSSSLALERRNGREETALIVNAEQRSPLAEAYRHLRTSVLLATTGRAPKTLLVTSSMPSEGKTTTAVNIALSLAQTGASVIVVDADLRRPRLHSLFNVSNRRGLSTILSRGASEAEALSAVTQDKDSGLHLLTSGSIPPNPAEMLGSEQMRGLITTLEGAFTHVVIDSPPVGSFTDGVVLSTMVDGVLLVVQSGRTSRQVARRTRQQLQDVGAKIFGVVLNSVNLRDHDYYYYRSYYGHSYYNSEEEEDQVTAA